MHKHAHTHIHTCAISKHAESTVKRHTDLTEEAIEWNSSISKANNKDDPRHRIDGCGDVVVSAKLVVSLVQGLGSLFGRLLRQEPALH